MEEVFYLRTSGLKYLMASLPKPPQNIAPIEKPSNDEAVAGPRNLIVFSYFSWK